MNNFFASLHAERVLSFSNWRYRLLHWTFLINPKTVEESPLPKFLYSHYCPLFHFTNLLFVLTFLVPLIPVLQLAIVVGIALARALHTLASYFEDTIISRRQERTPAKKSISRLFREISHVTEASFNFFWNNVVAEGWEVTAEDRATWESRWSDMRAAQAEAREKRAIAAEARKNRIIFWSHISSVVFKAILIVGGAIIGGAALYTCVFYVVPAMATGALWAIKKLYAGMFVDWFAIGWVVLKLVLAGAILAGGAVAIFYALRWLARRSYLDAIINPFRTLKSFAAMPFVAAGNGLANAIESSLEFVSILFSENCPPIKIVNDEEE